MKSRTLWLNSHFSADQIATLVLIAREELGDNASRPAFNESMLLAFENIAGFEALSEQEAARLLGKLWRKYQCACKSSGVAN